MGQAKNRGTFEERRAAAVTRIAEAVAKEAIEAERVKKEQEARRLAVAHYRRNFTIASLIATAPPPKAETGT